MSTVRDPFDNSRQHERTRVGLCLECRHMRLITSDRGSRFYRCGLSDVNPNFARYPTLPVIQCDGYEHGDGGAITGAPQA
jgi:hypothetical protein